MSEKKKQYDMNSPEAKALIDEIVHGTFMKEGTMVAFPTCFPGASLPIVADESRITALDITPDGIVYGGTSGRLTHLIVGMFHGVTGMVFDMGTVEGANQCPAIACGKGKFVACVNGPRGGRIVTAGLQGLPFDLIQEWGFGRQAFQDLGEVVKGEPIVHAVIDPARSRLVGTTTGHLFAVDVDGSKIQVVDQIKGTGRVAFGSKGNVYGLDDDDCLWRYEPQSGKVSRKAIRLPQGTWGKAALTWARNHQTGMLYLADADGTLFGFSEEQGFGPRLGRTLLAPVGPMAVTHDGRVFGFCGAEMAKMFCYNPHRGEVTNLGVAVSILERRRYGYVFGDAVTGRDGQVFFGEDDDMGHLWIYFPKVQGMRCH
jgi:hypothetical protein